MTKIGECFVLSAASLRADGCRKLIRALAEQVAIANRGQEKRVVRAQEEILSQDRRAQEENRGQNRRAQEEILSQSRRAQEEILSQNRRAQKMMGQTKIRAKVRWRP